MHHVEFAVIQGKYREKIDAFPTNFLGGAIFRDQPGFKLRKCETRSKNTRNVCD